MSESFFSRFNPLTGSYRREKPLSVRGAETAIDFSPLAAVKTGQEIYEESQSEDPSLLKMGIMAAGEAAGLIPIAGPAVKTMVRRVPADLADEIAGLNRRSVDTEIGNYRLNLERNTDLSPDEIDVRVENYASKQEGSASVPVRDLTETEVLADEIATDLRAGRTDLVTDERLEELDFLGEIRLRQHYIDGNVGVDADGIPITLDNAEREARMLAQDYERVGVHGTMPTQEGVSVDDIRVMRPSSYGKSGRGVYLDVEPTGMNFGDGEIVNPSGIPYPTANRFAGYNPDPKSIDRGKGAANRIPEGAQMYPLVQRGPFAKSKDYTSTRRELLEQNPDLNTVELDAMVNQRLMDQGFTGVDSTHYGEITSFEGGNLRSPTAVFDPRLTNLKNIGMADGGAVMNGIGTLNETARNMFRGPRGIGVYQQYAMGGEASGPPPMRGPDPQGIARYAPGGPVKSIRPQARPEAAPEFSAPLTSLRPETRREPYFEINSSVDERDGVERPIISFKDGARMFLTDVENMIDGNKTASEPIVGKSTAEEVLEFLQEKNPTSQEFLNYFSSARLAEGGPVLSEYQRALIASESSGRSDVVNESGYRGLTQGGDAAISDFKDQEGLDFTDEEYINSPDLQMQFQRWYEQKTINYVMDKGLDAYIGRVIKGVPITMSSLLGMAHIGGDFGMQQFLETGGRYDPDDGNTSLSDYGRKFANMAVYGESGGENFNRVTPEDALMSMPVEQEGSLEFYRPRARPPEIEFSAPLTSLRPQARTVSEEMSSVNRPLALPEGRSMIEKYGLPGDMPESGIMSAIR